MPVGAACSAVQECARLYDSDVRNANRRDAGRGISRKKTLTGFVRVANLTVKEKIMSNNTSTHPLFTVVNAEDERGTSSRP